MTTTPIPLLVMAGALGTLLAGACGRGSVETPPAPMVSGGTQESPGKVRTEQAVTVSATVQDIDHASRMVTLLTSDGEEIAFRASDDVRNLDRVKKGDVVQTTYYESIAIALKKRGEAEPGIKTATESDRAKLGQRPGGVTATSTSLTATIVDIDKKRQTVTLKGPQGETRTMPVEHPEHLEHAKVGDLVEVVYTEAIGVAVEPPAK